MLSIFDDCLMRSCVSTLLSAIVVDAIFVCVVTVTVQLVCTFAETTWKLVIHSLGIMKFPFSVAYLPTASRPCLTLNYTLNANQLAEEATFIFCVCVSSSVKDQM